MAVGLAVLVALLVIFLSYDVIEVNSNVVFHVKHKYGGRKHIDGRSFLDVLKTHDTLRHGRMLADVNLPVGGNGSPTDSALYFTKLSIGTPVTDYYVQVDTGSDVLWVNCAGCQACPKKSSLGIHLKFYDPHSSSTGKAVTCDQDFCKDTFNTDSSYCKASMPCQFSLAYGDGSTASGSYMRDTVMLDQMSGNFQTTPMNSTVVFGCTSQQSGDQGSSSASVDGIIGFGQAKSSMISQLASTGKVKKIFSHCLDGINGGGIFAVGEVVQPKVKVTPLVPNEQHYNVNLKAIEVGGDVLDLPKDYFGSASGSGAIIDSGTTLAYLPDDVYVPLMRKVMAGQPDIQIQLVQSQFRCFSYAGNVDDGFPVVKLLFEDSLPLTVYPHDYFFDLDNGEWCIGWQKKGMQTRDGREMTLLGDLVLSNKLVVYDLENQTIGWTDYNCASNIKVKDEKSGNVYTVAASRISSAFIPNEIGPLLLFALFFGFFAV